MSINSYFFNKTTSTKERERRRRRRRCVILLNQLRQKGGWIFFACPTNAAAFNILLTWNQHVVVACSSSEHYTNRYFQQHLASTIWAQTCQIFYVSCFYFVAEPPVSWHDSLPYILLFLRIQSIIESGSQLLINLNILRQAKACWDWIPVGHKDSTCLFKGTVATENEETNKWKQDTVSQESLFSSDGQMLKVS